MDRTVFLDLFLHPHLGWAPVFFCSAFNASSEKIGSFASSASPLTKFSKALNVTIFLDLVCVSWACRHHLTAEYEGSLLLTRRRVSLESRSPIDCIVFIDSSQRTRKSKKSWRPLLSPSLSLTSFLD